MSTEPVPMAHQTWRDMVFLHWPVEASALRRLLPPSLSVDQRDGTGWVSLLPFRCLGSRPVGVPRALGFDYLECNLRTYVTHQGEPGIWMFSLDASSRLAVWGARAVFGLPFVPARMSRHGRGPELGYTVDREGGGHLRVRAAAARAFAPAEPGSLSEWLLERYSLFVQRRTDLLRQRVLHAPYMVADATIFELDQDLTSAAGLTVERLGVRAHVTPGVSVTFLKPDLLATRPMPSDLEARTPV